MWCYVKRLHTSLFLEIEWKSKPKPPELTPKHESCYPCSNNPRPSYFTPHFYCGVMNYVMNTACTTSLKSEKKFQKTK